jgi:hypothetical protein
MNYHRSFKSGQFKSSWLAKLGRYARDVIIVALFLEFGPWVALGTYSYFVSHTADAQVVEAQVATSTPAVVLPPVMQRIEKCESSDSQTKDGQTLIHVNADKSYDSGEFQINSIWNATASKMGYDLSKQSDNEAFALVLYANNGTEPWYNSKQCWDK